MIASNSAEVAPPERLPFAGTSSTRVNTTKCERGGFPAPPRASPILLRCQLFRLALVPHQFERALGFLVRLGDFLLYLGGGLFHFR